MAIQILPDSLLKFECITQINTKNIKADSNPVTHVGLTDDLSRKGVTLIPTTVKVEESEDNIKYTDIDTAGIDDKSANPNVEVYVNKANILDTTKFLKFSFSASITDNAAYNSLLANGLTNTANFSLYKDTTPDGATETTYAAEGITRSTSLRADATPVDLEEYSPDVCATSLSLCPADGEVNFTSKLCFNTPCGALNTTTTTANDTVYNFVITLDKIAGITYPTTAATDILVYSDCCALDPENPLTTGTITVENTDTTLKITIPYETATDIDLSGYDCLAVAINCTATADFTESTCVNGSLELQKVVTAAGADTTSTIASINSFSFCVNIDCGDFMPLRKTLVC